MSQGPLDVAKFLLDTLKIEDASTFIGNTITQDVRINIYILKRIINGSIDAHQNLLHLAVKTENIAVVRTVCTCCPKTNVNAVNRSKMTPLHAVSVKFKER